MSDEGCIVGDLRKLAVSGKRIDDVFPWDISGYPYDIKVELCYLGSDFLKDRQRRKQCKRLLQYLLEEGDV